MLYLGAHKYVLMLLIFHPELEVPKKKILNLAASPKPGYLFCGSKKQGNSGVRFRDAVRITELIAVYHIVCTFYLGSKKLWDIQMKIDIGLNSKYTEKYLSEIALFYRYKVCFFVFPHLIACYFPFVFTVYFI